MNIKFDYIGFFSNILAVILGIAITFYIQGIIDKKTTKDNIESALSLVRDELSSCRNDLSSSADFMDAERVAARYLQEHSKDLKSCPKDSVAIYGSTYISHMILTLPNDALELLHASSIFSSMNNNELSLLIIRAYDQCKALLQIFNMHEELKVEMYHKILDEKDLDKTINPDGSVSIMSLMDSKYGKQLTLYLQGGSAGNIRDGLADIDKAIDAIDAYLVN